MLAGERLLKDSDKIWEEKTFNFLLVQMNKILKITTKWNPIENWSSSNIFIVSILLPCLIGILWKPAIVKDFW